MKRFLIPLAGALLAMQSPPAKPPQMGVYRWAGQPANVDAYAEWIGHSDIWGEDFLPTAKWENIVYPEWLTHPWSKWVKAREGRRVIIGVPMLVGPWDQTGPLDGIDARKPVSHEAGGRGEYNHHFRTLAEKLVASGLERSIIRLGWEFNGGWYTWRAKGKEKAFIDYWIQIVKTMKAVPGGDKLEFCWNPNGGWNEVRAEEAYPGNEFVDYVGVDVYDQSWEKDTYPYPPEAGLEEILARQKKVWERTYHGDHGLKFWRDFALERRKPLCLPEWAIWQRKDGHGGLDNPYYIEKMHQFITDPANNVAFHVYFDVMDAEEGHQLSPGPKGEEKTRFPKAAAKFRELFGAAPR